MDISIGILTLLAGVGSLMVGMKMLSDGLESSAGPGMRKMLNRISGNRMAGVGVGAGVTAIVQSSAAITVMTIGFVNAGLMTLMQAAAIIMGANIGTTVTGVIVSLQYLDIVPYIMMVFALIGVAFVYAFKRESLKKVGGILSGLGLIFIGLELMNMALTTPEIMNALKGVFANPTVQFPLMIIILGTIFTAVVQSSTAVTSILILLASQGIIEPISAFYVVLGSNIGTCITALIACIGANTNAKRTAMFHLVFNVLGAVLFLPMMIPAVGDGVVKLFAVFGDAGMQVAWFHVFFNILTTGIMLPFLKPLVRLTELLVRDKTTTAEEGVYKPKHLDERLLQTPPIALQQAQLEIVNMSELVKTNLDRATDALFTGNLQAKDAINETEREINFLNHSIAKFLIRLSALSVSSADETKIGAYHHVISDIERIGDHAENFIEQAEKMQTENMIFSVEATAELMRMYSRVQEMYDLSLRTFKERKFTNLERVSKLEEEVDGMKAEFGRNHVTRLNAGDCQVERGTYFFLIISAMERIGDHLVNIAFSIKNPIGSQNAAKTTRTPRAHKKEQ